MNTKLLSARLESVPLLYGCLIVVGEHMARLAENVFVMRELDWLLVKGADKPMSVYQPIAELDSATVAQKEILARYALALEHYRAGRFADACSIWDALAGEYEPSPKPVIRDGGQITLVDLESAGQVVERHQRVAQ